MSQKPLLIKPRYCNPVFCPSLPPSLYLPLLRYPYHQSRSLRRQARIFFWVDVDENSSRQSCRLGDVMPYKVRVRHWRTWYLVLKSTARKGEGVPPAFNNHTYCHSNLTLPHHTPTNFCRAMLCMSAARGLCRHMRCLCVSVRHVRKSCQNE